MAAQLTGEICDYNWDEIEVGDYKANNSEFFFAQQHPKHERFLNENGDEEFPVLNEKKSSAKENLSAEEILQAVNRLSLSPRAPLRSKSLVDNQRAKAPAAVNGSNKPGFNVCKFSQIYDAKKKARLQSIQQIEKKQREFRSQPAPNFRAIHAATERKREHLSPQITCPATPAVLKRHKETQERLKKKREEYNENLKPKPFVSQSPDVLRKRPFVPHYEKCNVVPVPFNLKTSSRLELRRQYDENFKTESERKKLEKEEQDRLEDERFRKELRKATTFKAQPNPFK